MMETLFFLLELLIGQFDILTSLAFEDLPAPLGPLLKVLVVVIPLGLFGVGFPTRVVRCVLIAVGHMVKAGGRSAKTLAWPLLLMATLFFLGAGLVSARCVTSGSTMICGDGGICDMDAASDVEHLYLNGKINNPTAEAALHYLPNLKVRSFSFFEMNDNFGCIF